MSNPTLHNAATSADDSGSRSKRRRTSGVYNRKRAVTACQPCRLRKTKCDNMRPVCGFCQSSGGHCVFPDATSDYSSHDPATLAILDRINHVVRLLEASPNAGGRGTNINHPDSTANPASTPPTIAPNVGASSNFYASISLESREEEPLLNPDAPDFFSVSNSCEGILSWPVFRDEAPKIDSFVFEDPPLDDSEAQCRESLPKKATQSGNIGRGIQEEDFIPLSRRFLNYIHVKNPILDINEFKCMVKGAADDGTRWDAPSCLVLLACGLGALANPFIPLSYSDGTPESVQSTSSVSGDFDTATSYYFAARKRLGLLSPSLIHVQCLFLCGIFEMYLLNALQAWFYFNQACVQFQNLWTRSRRGCGSNPDASTEVSHKVRRLEQRLYWSCMKSECELRCEIPLPASGITRFDYPDLLPSPPTELASPPTDAQILHPDMLHNASEPEEERSWYYYLTEISFRRIMDRAMVTLGRRGVRSWLDNVEGNIKVCEDLDGQIDVWISHIPPPINTDHSEAATNELAHLTRNRARACREWIHRPFVYFLVHHDPHDPSLANVALRVVPLARRCLQLCVDLIVQSFAHYRHHGTWFVTRSGVTRALLLLAAARSRRVSMPDGWMEAVNLAMRSVELWSAEAPDLQRMGEVLGGVVRRTYAQISVQ